ncbi:MAG: histidinol dehydrogenase [Bacteroidota bacterium]
MKTYLYPSPDQWPALLERPVMQLQELSARVQPILDEVRDKGDAAVKEFTARFDKVELKEIVVTEAEFREAERLVSEPLKEAIQLARDNIQRFHQQQWEQFQPLETMPGVRCWRKSVPIDRVGLYIPGGTAPLFSSILMLGVPAMIAGCETIVLCTPPGADGKLNPAMLYTASLLGIKTVCKVGGAQAVAAMAYGTESVPQVYKIFGPGNQYVTLAKQLVSREGVAIDMPAGPSEVAVVGDDSAEPDFVAADLLSQAEHGIDSQVLLVSQSEAFVEAVSASLERQIKTLPREEIARQAIANSRSIVLRSEEEVVSLINQYAPEHLILAVKEDEALGEKIQNAGSVFLGHYTPESVGDYASGTNHTLPTNGYARAYSGVSLDSFLKKITFQKLSPAGLQALGPAVELMAEAEELAAHKLAVSVRLAKLNAES